MVAHRHFNRAVLLVGALFLAACGSGSETAGQAAADSETCRETPAAQLSPSAHGCALVAEMRAVADTLASVTDQASADRAASLLRKSSERLEALRKERLKLNDDPKAGAKGAMVGMHMPAASAASRKIVEESMRIAQTAPHLFRTLEPAMEDMEF